MLLKLDPVPNFLEEGLLQPRRVVAPLESLEGNRIARLLIEAQEHLAHAAHQCLVYEIASGDALAFFVTGLTTVHHASLLLSVIC
jgi:hypothetical protein